MGDASVASCVKEAMDEYSPSIEVYQTENPGYAPESVITAEPKPDFVPDVKMGFHSKQVTCPICHEETATYVWYQPGRLANVVFAVTCLTGTWCFCPIPFYFDGCMDAHHKCPECRNFIGFSERWCPEINY